MKVVEWAEAHPTEAILIGGAGVLVILYLMGFFGSNSASNSASQGASNMAAAYYAAEAQQAVVGGQIQEATINDAATTAQVQDQVQGAVAINQAQQTAATTIAGSQLGAVQSTNSANVAIAQSNNAALVNGQETALQTTLGQTMLGTIVPQELALSGGTAGFNLPGLGVANVDPLSQAVATSPNSPESLANLGYTPAQIASVLGVPNY